MRPTTAPRRYEIFDPQTELVDEEQAVTFLVYLPEFRKDELKVQLTSTRHVRISGERPLGDDKWKRFVKEIRVPEECDTKGIVAKFDSGILYVKQPKLVQPKPEPEPEPAPAPAPIDAPSNVPDDEKMEDQEPRKDDKTVDQTSVEGDAKEDRRKSLDHDENGMESGDIDNADFGKKINEEQIGQNELGNGEQAQVINPGGLFNNNLRKLLLVFVSIIAPLIQMIYVGRLFKRA